MLAAPCVRSTTWKWITQQESPSWMRIVHCVLAYQEAPVKTNFTWRNLLILPVLYSAWVWSCETRHKEHARDAKGEHFAITTSFRFLAINARPLEKKRYCKNVYHLPTVKSVSAHCLAMLHCAHLTCKQHELCNGSLLAQAIELQ